MRQWQAKWVWADERRVVNDHLLFRADVDLAGVPRKAELFIAAESFAIVYVNGREVHRTSSLSYPGQHYYETADVADALQPGVNRLAVVVWYIGVPSGASCPKDPGLLCEIVNGDGALIAGSGAEWRVKVLDAWLGQHRRSHWLNLDLIEILDYRRLPDGFPMVADLSDFDAAKVQGPHAVRYVRIEPRPFPKPTGEPLADPKVAAAGIVTDRSAEFELPARAVTAERIEPADLQIADLTDFTLQPPPAGKAASLILDLGAYEKGFPILQASGCEGASIDISWYEHLDRQDASKVYTTDRYILSGRTDFIRPEEWKCGRYLQLTFRNVTAPLRITGLHWLRCHYPLKRKVAFRSSDPRLERIWEIGLAAAAACMHDNIMDCPWRERRQWIGDAQRIALVNHYAFGDRDLVRGVLRQQVQMQDPSGRIFVCLPIFEEYPTQTMEWLRAVCEYRQYTSDTTLVPEIIDNIEMLHRWFLRCRDGRDLLFVGAPPVMNWMDNPYGSVVTPTGTIRQNQFRTALAAMNLRYLLFLDDVAACLRQVGRRAAAEAAVDERRRLSSIIAANFLDPATGMLRDCAEEDIDPTFSELAHALAVLAAPDGIDAEAAFDAFDAYRREGNANVIVASPYGKHQTFEALGKLGRTDAIVEEILAFWGPMVDAGADTSWEQFNGKGSRCHGWGGVVAVALMRHVLKLDPTVAGSARADNAGPVRRLECDVNP